MQRLPWPRVAVGLLALFLATAFGARAAGPGSECLARCGGAGRCVALCARALADCRRTPDRDAGCEVVVVRARPGPAPRPVLPRGRPAELDVLLDASERAVVAAADARATELRSRAVVLQLGRPGVAVEVVQQRHGFTFGFPIDLLRFRDAAELDFYAGITRAHFGLAVLENSAKWASVEPAPGERRYARADADVAWALEHGFTVKGHTLLWGITPPFSSSGIPGWVLERFGALPELLSPLEQVELRARLRDHVTDLVARYRGDVALWDVTNETLQVLAQWFVRALGPEIVEDAFRWAHAADPDATLVFNEWIVEVFTGFQSPTAADVRDRVLALRAAGVPVHALGQQAHFAPALAFAGLPADLSQRTRIDDYAVALDTLAQAGLPIHVTETNFIAPEEPERRAAQAEALMRLWWGHPAVEQIVFWGPWNRVAGRDEFDVGLWDDAGNLSRHGEAVLSLLNDRWRTAVSRVSDARGRVALRAYHGEHAVEWRSGGAPVHGVFRVEPGAGPVRVVLLAPEAAGPRRAPPR